ncbi:MAG: YwqG family protein [Bacteroidota bacterium]
MGLTDKLFEWLNPKDAKSNGKKAAMDTSPILDIADFEAKMKAQELESYIPKIQPHLRQGIAIELSPMPTEEMPPGQSKIGGSPDLPSEQAWPLDERGAPLSFLAQINLRESAPFDKAEELPSEGMLSFFYCADQEAWGFDPKDKERFRVLYFPDTEYVERREFPAALNEDAQYVNNSLNFSSYLGLPGWENHRIEQLFPEEEDEVFDNYVDMSDGPDTHLLGHANSIQNPMELECQLVTNGLYCGDPSGYKDPRAKELGKGKDQWVLLFQLDSEDSAEMMWGDVGRIYFWIKKEDLQQKRFDQAWMISQCH